MKNKINAINVATVMAVYQPNLKYLHEQIESILNQAHIETQLFIVVDSESKIGLEKQYETNKNVKFFYGSRKNVYGNFERAIHIALKNPACTHICFSDQDDYWFPEKISRLLNVSFSSNCALVHSNLYLGKSADLSLATDVWKSEKRQTRFNLMDLFIRNSVTGSSMLVTKELALAALPFPIQDKNNLKWHHDLWIALIAASTKKFGIAWVAEPLGIYRQHGQNVVGAVIGVYKPRTTLQAIIDYRARRQILFATKSRIEELNIKVERNLNLIASPFVSFLLGYRFIISALNRSPETTLTWYLFIASILNIPIALVRRLLLFKLKLFGKFTRFVAAMKIQNTMRELHGSISAVEPIKERVVFSKASAVAKIYIFLPTVRESSLFGGILTALNLGLCLAELGYSVTIVPTDIRTSQLNQKSTEELIKRAKGEVKNLDFKILPTSEILTISDKDLLIATAWWTMKSLQEIKERFPDINLGYLIQDFEPGFSPWGKRYAETLATYDGDFIPIMNTSLLQEFFRQNVNSHFKKAIVFAPEHIKVPAVKRNYKVQRPISIFFYARPSVERNMFQLGMEVLWLLGEWSTSNGIEIEVHLAGEKIPSLRIPGLNVVLHGKMKPTAYAELLQKIDIGISLMFSPHPSYVPFEIASAGAWSLSNSCFNKKPGLLGENIRLIRPIATELFSELVSMIKSVQSGKFPNPQKRDTNLGNTIIDASTELISRHLQNTSKNS